MQAGWSVCRNMPLTHSLNIAVFDVPSVMLASVTIGP